MNMLRYGILMVMALSVPYSALADPFDSWQYRDAGRIEVGVGGGFVPKDLFLAQSSVNWRVAIHVHELFAVDLRWLASPTEGEADVRYLTHLLENRWDVDTHLSRVAFAFTPGLLVSPLHAEAPGFGALDVSFYVGGGMVRTLIDFRGAPVGDDSYTDQIHPVFVLCPSIRLKIADVVAIGFHPIYMVYPEQEGRADGLLEQVKRPGWLIWQVSLLTPRLVGGAAD